MTISSGATLNQTSGALAATNWVWLGTTFAGSILNSGAMNLSGGSCHGNPLVNNNTMVINNSGVTINGGDARRDDGR